MAHKPTKKITVPEGSDLAKLLTDAGSRPILLEKNGELYRLERMEDKDTMPSPEDVARSREGIREAAGSWKDIDTVAFKAYINDQGVDVETLKQDLASQRQQESHNQPA